MKDYPLNFVGKIIIQIYCGIVNKNFRGRVWAEPTSYLCEGEQVTE